MAGVRIEGPHSTWKRRVWEMVLSKIENFVCPVLQLLDALGGEAEIREIEDGFYKRFGKYLDPSKDWFEIKRNHGKELWRDYCGTRVAYYFLRPRGYITTRRCGRGGSIYKLTPEGKAVLTMHLRSRDRACGPFRGLGVC